MLEDKLLESIQELVSQKVVFAHLENLPLSSEQIVLEHLPKSGNGFSLSPNPDWNGSLENIEKIVQPVADIFSEQEDYSGKVLTDPKVRYVAVMGMVNALVHLSNPEAGDFFLKLFRPHGNNGGLPVLTSLVLVLLLCVMVFGAVRPQVETFFDTILERVQS